MNYVTYEFSYDSYLPNAESVYRVDYFESQANEVVVKSARTHTGLSTFLQENMPEAEHVAKMYNENCLLFNQKAKGYQKGAWVDSSFLNVFELKLLSGNREKALSAPNMMAISQSLAKVYFGEADPIGKSIYLNEHIPFVITAVFADLPDNTAVKFDFLISWSTLEEILYDGPQRGDFRNPWVFTYVKLNSNVKDMAKVEAQLEKIAADNVPDLREKNLKGFYKLRPVREIHFAKGMTGEPIPGRDKAILYALICVAFFILVAAWINYINLSLAQAFQRAEEIMVRKVYGAKVSHIINQFIVEALIISLVTALAGLGLYFLFVNWLSGYLSATFYITQGMNYRWLWYLILIIALSVASAIFPARLIARYNPAFILKRQYRLRESKSLIKNGLVVFQMLLSIFTIGCTIIANMQINYMQSFDVGFNTSHTISLVGPASKNTDSLRYQRFLAFRDEILKSSAFVAGTASMNIPGEELRFHDESIRLVGSQNDKKRTFWTSNTDDGYLKTFGLKLLAGRNINENDKHDRNCMINATAAKALGFQNPEDAVNAQFLNRHNKKRTIVGVIQDFHHESLRKNVEPVVFYFDHPFEFGYYTFKTGSANRASTLKHLERVWKKHYPDDPFVYYFMDSFFNKQYQEDVVFSKLLKLFSIMSIIVASLGLLGLASLTVVKRTKEIGIRKVVGASVPRILMLLSKEYIQLVLISFAIILPVFYYAATQWLQIFSYRITLEWWMFILPGTIVLVIACLVVSGQALKAAITNPVRSLRTE